MHGKCPHHPLPHHCCFTCIVLQRGLTKGCSIHMLFLTDCGFIFKRLSVRWMFKASQIKAARLIWLWITCHKTVNVQTACHVYCFSNALTWRQLHAHLSHSLCCALLVRAVHIWSGTDMIYSMSLNVARRSDTQTIHHVPSTDAVHSSSRWCVIHA